MRRMDRQEGHGFSVGNHRADRTTYEAGNGKGQSNYD